MIIRPSFFSAFACIASRCRDNCCIGWEIDIDEETDRFYRKTKGEFGKQLHKGISREGQPHFKLQGEACYFLNSDHLCEIYRNLGEEHLCGICREHPRFYEWYEDIPGLPDRTEAGLGLCCEEAARLLFSEEQPLAFETEWESLEEKNSWEQAVSAIRAALDRSWDRGAASLLESEPEEGNFSALEPGMEQAAYLVSLFQAREKAISILQNRREGLGSRVRCFLTLTEHLQAELDAMDPDDLGEAAAAIWNTAKRAESSAPEAVSKAAETGNRASEAENHAAETGNRGKKQKADRALQAYCSVLEALEPIHPDWPERMRKLNQEREILLAAIPDFMEKTGYWQYAYEHLMVYFVYRYWGKAAYDGDLLSRASLAVASAALVMMLDLEAFHCFAGFSLEQQADDAKDYSREIEYSEENMAFLEQVFWEREELSLKAIKELAEILWPS